MKRRAFVLAGVGAASAWVAWQLVGGNAEETVAMVVRRRLDYLKLDSEGLRRFSREMVALHAISNTKMHVLSGIRSAYTRTRLSSGNNSLAYMLRHGEDRIVSAYLISSDFFANGADVSRVVKYHGMLNARRACSNPFARPPA